MQSQDMVMRQGRDIGMLKQILTKDHLTGTFATDKALYETKHSGRDGVILLGLALKGA